MQPRVANDRRKSPCRTHRQHHRPAVKGESAVERGFYTVDARQAVVSCRGEERPNALSHFIRVAGITHNARLASNSPHSRTGRFTTSARRTS